jgi:replicative DNA helicase
MTATYTERLEVNGQEATRYRFATGGSFILDTDPDTKALWGSAEEVLGADGEATIIVAPQGCGKTTLAQQYTLGRCGFPEYSTLLGFPIIPGQQKALYLAMDRPKQAARSFRRMVGEAWRDELDGKLSVWQGPPPYDLAKYPHLLLTLARQADADTVIVDSLKDAAVGLSTDDVAAAYNRARQTALAGGVQVTELHHMRKALSGAQAEHPTIDDVYGSTWITSGAGSVILLNGKPGDPIVSLHHLKQPAAEVGPFRVLHDSTTGRSTVWHSTDLLALAKRAGGITAQEAASALYETEKPEPGEREKARRRLAKLEEQGLLKVVQQGDKATNQPTKWGRE